MNYQKFWIALIIATLVSITGFGIAAWQLSQGAADADRIGTLQWTDTRLEWTQALPPENSQFFEAPSFLNRDGFTLEVSAELDPTADSLDAWGIWFQNQSGGWTVIAINGAGYVTARQCLPQDMRRLDLCDPLTEPTQQILTYWKAFRFIRPAGEMNTMRVDYRQDDLQLTLRLNREWMWDIPYQPATNSIQWGLWAQGTTEINDSPRWSKIQVWEAK